MKLRKYVRALALVLVVTLASTTLVAAQGIHVGLRGPVEVYLGDQAVIEVWVEAVSDFYGAQLTLAYDGGIVQAVSVEPGSAFTDFPDEYEVAKADIVSDTVSFAATLLRVPKAGPLQGDLQLAVITFEGVDLGQSFLDFVEVKLSDSAGNAIPFTSWDGAIDVIPPLTKLIGNAYMEGRTDHSGIGVTLMSDPVMTTTTNISGTYTFDNVPAGVYSVTMSADLYLDAMAINVEVLDNETNYACDVTMLGGDLVKDANERIDIADLAKCASHFETDNAEADVNADGIVDVYDLVLLGKNFMLTGPTVTSCAP
jgi:hypothetical protein